MYWRVIRTREGFGWVTPEDWATWPEEARRRVRVLVLCDTEAGAREEFAKLPKGWLGDTGPLRVRVGR